MRQYSILYIDIKGFAVEPNPLILTYYMLNCTGMYITADESEKEYGVSKCEDMEQVVHKIAELVNSVCSDLDTLLILSGRSNITDLLREVEKHLYVDTKLQWQSIQEYLGHNGFTLFELYNHYFNATPDLSLIEIIDSLITSVVRYKHGSMFEYSQSIIVVHPLARGSYAVLTFTWAKMNVHGNVEILGSTQCILPSDTDNYSRLGIFFKELETSIAKTGVTLQGLVPVFYTEASYNTYVNIVSGMDVNTFDNHTVLRDMLMGTLRSNIWNKLGNSFSNFMRVFSSKVSEEYCLSAYELCKVIRNTGRKLDMKVNGGVLTANRIYYKDFSADSVDTSLELPMKYYVILDCEGTPENGCSEVGGIIAGYNKRKGILIKCETFYFKRYEFTEGMQNLLDRYAEIVGRSTTYVPVLAYGHTDSVMVNNELEQSSSRGLRRKLNKVLKFTNAQEYIFPFLDEEFDTGLVNRKLSTVAEHLGVKVVMPEHNALNDAKTLFNVLACMIMFGLEID